MKEVLIKQILCLKKNVVCLIFSQLEALYKIKVWTFLRKRYNNFCYKKMVFLLGFIITSLNKEKSRNYQRTLVNIRAVH